MNLNKIPVRVETKHSRLSEMIGFDFSERRVFVKFRSSNKLFVYRLPIYANRNLKVSYEKRFKRAQTNKIQEKRLTHYISNFVIHLDFPYRKLKYKV
jgi:hypothetical protein